MVDFVSVIKRAIDSLPENTPDMRFQVYDRARIVVSRQLEKMKPRPPQEILDRQLRKLENAIFQVESKQHKIISVTDQKMSLDVPDNGGINSSNCILLASRLPVSSFSHNDDIISNRNTISDKQYAGKNMSITYSFIARSIYNKFINIFRFSSYSQHSYNNKSIFINADYTQGVLKKIGLEQFSCINNYLFIVIKKYFLSKEYGFLSFFFKLYDNNILKYSAISFIFLGCFIGISYSISKSQVNTIGYINKLLDNNSKNKLSVLTNTVPKITRRLLADGSEVDMDSSNASDLSNPSFNNVFVHNSLVDDKDVNNNVVSLSKGSKLEKTAGNEGASIAFINKGYGNPLAFAKNIAWSLQEGSQGLMIKGNIPTIGSDLSALIVIKRNFDISLAATHLIEIVFSLEKGNQGGDITDLRQISMRKTEKGPGVFFDSNIFRTAKNSYLISLKNSLNNSEVLSEYRWMDIPITYSNGKRIILTIDKGRTGADIFKMAISNWESQTKKSIS
ncbi:hypothetical protein [Candidatus Liberibacter americanus]|uniref:Uncharacterized protein n=1 Tax=Candidatus Liberibacter americanus str. Sao Paulo TaxID=1261131 RepID=U6B5M6_9HYPH|nr:hypothetical protein lam_1035 [Candidatus Liberibacter americanus str. Sao Paulo]EMS36649.1 transmembrane protein [Candidatus Liberibacter americanus PW_SP]